MHADAGWDLKRIINGLIGGNGGQDIGVIFTQGPFREDEASTPQLISTPKATNVAVQYPLDLADQPKSFDEFWSGLPKMMKRRAWRNHWRMAFHPSVYVDIQRSRPACECRSCKDREALFDPA